MNRRYGRVWLARQAKNKTSNAECCRELDRNSHADDIAGSAGFELADTSIVRRNM